MTANELIPNPQDRIICIKVGKIIRENFYEMARKYWIVNLERASKATHVLAIVNGIVHAVYIPEKWMHSKDSGYEGRCEFIGSEDPTSEFIGKSVVHFYGNSQNAVKYINM